MGDHAKHQLPGSEGDVAATHGSIDDSPSKHPRIGRLRQQVSELPANPDYRSRLQRSIDLYADHIVARPEYSPDEGWDDLEALQQVTLSDWMEQMVRQDLESLYPDLRDGQNEQRVKVTKDKVMGRSTFIKFVESLDQPGYALPVEMDEEVKAVIVRTWKQLQDRGLDVSSLVNHQGLRDLAASHEVSPAVLLQAACGAATAMAKSAVEVSDTSVRADAPDDRGQG